MLRSAHHELKSWSAGFVVCLFVIAIAQGCGNTSNSGNQADDAFLKNAEFPRVTLAKFSGKITIDGKPPKKDCKLFVILTDPKHLDENAHGILPKYFAVCDDEGKFGFSTYAWHDGVAVGKYVVTFVELHPQARSGSGRAKALKGGAPSPSGGTRFGQPDELKNLYSDPDKNIDVTKFFLDLQPPGKDDDRFDLAVAGKEPVPKPAPHAVQSLAPKQLDWPPAAASAAK